MITMKQLDELEEKLMSGEFERDFKAAGEIQRGRMLEYLEKIMDIADLADETATRLIFRSKESPDKNAK